MLPLLTPEAYPISPHSKTNLTIEAWRGFAAVLVMFCHYRGWWILGPSYADLASTGVDLFFVLSGFVFAPSILEGISSFRAFMVRRIFRIYPLYLLALLAYVVLGHEPFSIRAILAHLLMLQNSFSVQMAFFYNPVFWSLPPEWWFYSTLPVFILVVRVWGLWPCVLALIALRIGLGFGVEPPATAQIPLTLVNWAVINLPGIACELMIGVLVYWCHGQQALRQYRIVVTLCWIVFLGLAYIGYGQVLQATPAPVLGNLVGVIAAALYAIALWLSLVFWGQPSAWRASLAKQMGAISYGVYLFHNLIPLLIDRIAWVLPAWAMTIVCVALTGLIAYAAHRWFEAPLRAYGRQMSARYCH